jgi:methylmalonyl-CoA/ethylmalonyl-CoA epimerase
VIEYAFFGTDAAFHHIGLAVRSIRAVSPSSEVFVERTQRVSLAFVLLNGIRVELLEPLGDDSPIARSLREGGKLLHLCYAVPDLDAALRLCRPAGFHRLGPPVPTTVFDNRRIVWVFSRQYGLFELLERGRSSAVMNTGVSPFRQVVTVTGSS